MADRKAPLTVRVYFRMLRGIERLWWIIQAVSSGFWLGVLGTESLHEIDRRYYDSKRQMYFDEGWNTRGLLEWEQRAVETYFGSCARILVSSVGGLLSMTNRETLSWIW